MVPYVEPLGFCGPCFSDRWGQQCELGDWDQALISLGVYARDFG